MPGAGGFFRSDGGFSTSSVKLPWKTSLHFWHQGDLQSLNLMAQPWRLALQNFRKTRILPNSVEKRSLEKSLQLQEQRAFNSVLWAIRSWRLALAFLRDSHGNGSAGTVLKKMPWRNALQLFWTLKRRTRFCYNACIEAVSKAPQQALGLLTMMRQEGLQPDSATWSLCIYASRKSWRRALGLVTQVRRQLRWDLEHFGPDVKLESLLGASNAALSSCALGKRWQNAVDVLTHLGRASIEANEISHTTFMGSFQGQGRAPRPRDSTPSQVTGKRHTGPHPIQVVIEHPKWMGKMYKGNYPK
eukprot:symbB.v1.2.016948.t1/scaffold1306.1/size125945/7